MARAKVPVRSAVHAEQHTPFARGRSTQAGLEAIQQLARPTSNNIPVPAGPIRTQEFTVAWNVIPLLYFKILKGHGPVRELSLADFLIQQREDSVMSWILTDLLVKRSHGRLFPLNRLHEISAAIQEQPRHPNLLIVDLALLEQLVKLRLAELLHCRASIDDVNHDGIVKTLPRRNEDVEQYPPSPHALHTA